MTSDLMRCPTCDTSVWHRLAEETERGYDVLEVVGETTLVREFIGRKFNREVGEITCENDHVPPDELLEIVGIDEEWT